MELSYPNVFYHNSEENVYVAVVPDLPGCSTGGDTFEEAYINKNLEARASLKFTYGSHYFGVIA